MTTDRDDTDGEALFPAGDGGDAPVRAEAAARPYTVLARKYRPKTFAELIGQDAMVRTLGNAFSTGRIAQAYMLTGVRGVGKTTTARLIARALNYEPMEGGGGPTIDMPTLGRHCAAILESRHLDVVEMDAASHTGIEDVRDLIERAQYRPVSARTKVYIVDEVHMLSKQAFNGLLKTLEEPPPHVKFVFATTEIRKVPVTVLSRCQRFDLRRVEIATLVERLAAIAAAEGATAEIEALQLVARAAEGSVRDSLSILDQAIAHGAKAVIATDVRAMLGLADRGRTLDLLEIVLRGDAKGALESFDALHADGADPVQVLAELAEATHQITRCKVAGPDAVDPALSQQEAERAKTLAAQISIPVLARAWQMLLKGHAEAVGASQPISAAEMVLVRLAHVADWPTPGDLARGVSNGGRPPEAPTARQAASAAAPPQASRGETERASESPVTPAIEQPNTFEEVVELVAAKRDLMLKRELVEHVRLVRFGERHIEFAPQPGASPDLAQSLARKLTAWTDAPWLVSLVAADGAPTLGEVRRADDAKALEKLRRHPAVEDVFAHFPGAEIAEVRTLPIKSNRD